MTANGREGPSATFLRFFAVSATCLLLDLAIAWTLAARLGLPLPFAAAAGFAAGAVLGYLLHEYWTFRDGARRASSSRAARWAAVLVIVFVVRIGTVAALEVAWPAPEAVLAILVVAVGLSFAVNFALSRLAVFRALPGAGRGDRR